MRFQTVLATTTSQKYKSDKPSMTDPSLAPELDINNIVARYKKTGQLPQELLNTEQLQYVDVSGAIDYNDAMIKTKRAEQHFLTLPSEIRQLLKNNPQNLEEYVKHQEKLALEQQNANEKQNQKQKTNAKNPPDSKNPDPKSKIDDE